MALVIMTVVLVAIMVTAALLVRSARSDAMAAQQRADEARDALREALENQQKALVERGKSAARSSRSTFDGHVAENAFPYAAEHSYHPKDIIHVGGNIDFLVFDGLFEVRQGIRKPEDLTVVLADVKYGASALTREQRAVIAAMNGGRTRGEYWRAREKDGQLAYRQRSEAAAPRPERFAVDGGRQLPAAGFKEAPDLTQIAPTTDVPD
ncbi:Holliday junction resolvase-like protein [Streptomyces sp. NPDC050610]|uniref:Holliday junction resolvase-like protein n=1 Tax=Streptomyces sp. NPDC050610 TaxID=3157097 RepID=UPI00341F7D0B